MKTYYDSMPQSQIERARALTPETFGPYETMVRITKTADGRPMTAPQRDDFDRALKSFREAAGLMARDSVYGLKSLDTSAAEPEAAIKAAEAFMSQTDRMTYQQNSPVRSSHSQSGSARTDSWGDAVVELAESRGMKALLTTGSVPVSVPLNPDPVRDPVRPRHLREIIPSIANETGQYSYLRQTARTNNAAPVAEGAVKPTSVLTLERVDSLISTIAHLSEPIPRQQLDDAQLLRQFVDQELRYGLFVALDNQILVGNGTAPNLRGLNSTAGTQTVTTGADALVRVRTAITSLQAVDLEPDALVISPSDWARVESVAIAQYAANPNMSPMDLMTRRVFGVNVLVSTAATNGTAWLGAFRDGAFLVIREEARIDWSEAAYNVGPPISSDFERNLIRFRAEMRVGFAVTRPAGFVKITIA